MRKNVKMWLIHYWLFVVVAVPFLTAILFHIWFISRNKGDKEKEQMSSKYLHKLLIPKKSSSSCLIRFCSIYLDNLTFSWYLSIFCHCLLFLWFFSDIFEGAFFCTIRCFVFFSVQIAIVCVTSAFIKFVSDVSFDYLICCDSRLYSVCLFFTHSLAHIRAHTAGVNEGFILNLLLNVNGFSK